MVLAKAWNYVAEFRHHRLITSSQATCLRDLDELEAAVNAVRRRIVLDMHRDGCSWTEIGDALGLTRQGARQRYERYTTVTERVVRSG